MHSHLREHWDLSSVGSEHLPYKQGVAGSNPAGPTKKAVTTGSFFHFMPCYFYILYSTIRDRFYTGHSCDTLEKRIRKHNANHKGYTGRVNDWRLAYQEEFPNKEQAYARERQVKGWKSRKRIEALIKNDANPGR